jgi:predicted nucleic acid-binding Zn ribbon protein
MWVSSSSRKIKVPNYEYSCSLCNDSQELYRGFDETEVKPSCCDQEMGRVYRPTGILFRGGGFYKNGG